MLSENSWRWFAYNRAGRSTCPKLPCPYISYVDNASAMYVKKIVNRQLNAQLKILNYDPRTYLRVLRSLVSSSRAFNVILSFTTIFLRLRSVSWLYLRISTTSVHFSGRNLPQPFLIKSSSKSKKIMYLLTLLLADVQW